MRGVRGGVGVGVGKRDVAERIGGRGVCDEVKGRE